MKDARTAAPTAWRTELPGGASNCTGLPVRSNVGWPQLLHSAFVPSNTVTRIDPHGAFPFGIAPLGRPGVIRYSAPPTVGYSAPGCQKYGPESPLIGGPTVGFSPTTGAVIHVPSSRRTSIGMSNPVTSAESVTPPNCGAYPTASAIGPVLLLITLTASSTTVQGRESRMPSLLESRSCPTAPVNPATRRSVEELFSSPTEVFPNPDCVAEDPNTTVRVAASGPPTSGPGSQSMMPTPSRSSSRPLSPTENAPRLRALSTRPFWDDDVAVASPSITITERPAMDAPGGPAISMNSWPRSAPSGLMRISLKRISPPAAAGWPAASSAPASRAPPMRRNNPELARREGANISSRRRLHHGTATRSGYRRPPPGRARSPDIGDDGAVFAPYASHASFHSMPSGTAAAVPRSSMWATGYAQ